MTCFQMQISRPLLSQPYFEKSEDETHTPKMGTWESIGTPETSEFDCRGKNNSPFGHLKHKLWQKKKSGVKLAI